MDRKDKNFGARMAAASAVLLLAGILFLVVWSRDQSKESQQSIGPGPRLQQKGGLSLVVLDPSTLSQTGIVAQPLKGPFPLSAQIWMDGKTWVYVEEAPGEFRREEMSQAKPGDQVVVKGAQMLLSEEFRQIMPAGEGDDD